MADAGPRQRLPRAGAVELSEVGERLPRCRRWRHCTSKESGPFLSEDQRDRCGKDEGLLDVALGQPHSLEMASEGCPRVGARPWGCGEHSCHRKARPAECTVRQGQQVTVLTGLSCQRTSASARITRSWHWAGGRHGPRGQGQHLVRGLARTGHTWTEFSAAVAQFSQGSATTT